MTLRFQIRKLVTLAVLVTAFVIAPPLQIWAAGHGCGSCALADTDGDPDHGPCHDGGGACVANPNCGPGCNSNTLRADTAAVTRDIASPQYLLRATERPSTNVLTPDPYPPRHSA